LRQPHKYNLFVCSVLCLQGLALVGAVNCDDRAKNGALCQRFGIQGFPTLKLIGPQSTKDPATGRLSKEVQDYNGAARPAIWVDGATHGTVQARRMCVRMCVFAWAAARVRSSSQGPCPSPPPAGPRTAKPIAEAVTAVLTDAHITRLESAAAAEAWAGKASSDGKPQVSFGCLGVGRGPPRPHRGVMQPTQMAVCSSECMVSAGKLLLRTVFGSCVPFTQHLACLSMLSARQVYLFTNKRGSTTLYKALSTQLHKGLTFAEVGKCGLRRVCGTPSQGLGKSGRGQGQACVEGVGLMSRVRAALSALRVSPTL
jgi:hypothetical protein